MAKVSDGFSRFICSCGKTHVHLAEHGIGPGKSAVDMVRESFSFVPDMRVRYIPDRKLIGTVLRFPVLSRHDGKQRICVRFDGRDNDSWHNADDLELA